VRSTDQPRPSSRTAATTATSHACQTYDDHTGRSTWKGPRLRVAVEENSVWIAK
jgi:hypothetical protein